MRLSNGLCAVVLGLAVAFAGTAAGCDGESGAGQATARATTATTATRQAGGGTIEVADAAAFDAAVVRAEGGETILLADGAYPPLRIDRRTFSRPLRIVGSRKAKLAGLAIVDSSNLVIAGVTLTPPGQKAAKIAIKGSSSRIVVDGVFVDGREERVGALITTTDGSSNVTVRNSTLTNCGYGTGCVRPNARNLRILDNRFYDCRSCTFVEGGGSGAYIAGNTFDGATPGGCTGGLGKCPHNDLIHIQGGGPWTIVGNRFGDYKGGAAQIYANPFSDTNPVRDVLIASNVFDGDGGLAVRIGVGQKSRTPPPSNVRIVNNTILSGRLGTVLINDSWDAVPAGQRPVVANNILQKLNESSCGRALFASNLLLKGGGCPGDRAGDARLDAKTKAPTSASDLVVDRADPQYAPETDFYGRSRNGKPDLGAIELGGRPAATAVRLTAPATVSRSASTLDRAGWRLAIDVGLGGAETLRTRLLAEGKSLATISDRVSGTTQHTLLVPLPDAARRPGVLVLRLEARGDGNRSASRTITVRISP